MWTTKYRFLCHPIWITKIKFIFLDKWHPILHYHSSHNGACLISAELHIPGEQMTSYFAFSQFIKQCCLISAELHLPGEHRAHPGHETKGKLDTGSWSAQVEKFNICLNLYENNLGPIHQSFLFVIYSYLTIIYRIWP